MRKIMLLFIASLFLYACEKDKQELEQQYLEGICKKLMGRTYILASFPDGIDSLKCLEGYRISFVIKHPDLSLTPYWPDSDTNNLFIIDKGPYDCYPGQPEQMRGSWGIGLEGADHVDEPIAPRARLYIPFYLPNPENELKRVKFQFEIDDTNNLLTLFYYAYNGRRLYYKYRRVN